MDIKKIFYLGILILYFSFVNAQDFFSNINERSIKVDQDKRTVQPERYCNAKLFQFSFGIKR